jgi:hypothetical protein|tara:strand:+ start:259 stop:429 length:171 start_codon:yes stop_codon:yes gene_type:complete
MSEEDKAKLNETVAKVRDSHFKVKEIKKDEEGNVIPDEEGGATAIGLLPDIVSDAK